MELLTYLQNNILFFDGGMGSMLLSRGLDMGALPERLNLKNPGEITAIHKLYTEAGADVVTANTFGANRLKLREDTRAVIHAGIACARASGAKMTALDIGPLGQMLQPLGTLSFEDAYGLFAEMMEAGAEAGADLVLIETMSDLYEAKAAILAAREHTNLPVFCSMTFGADGRTFLGCNPQTAAIALTSFGVDALGINCSLGPEQLMPIAETFLKYTGKPVLVQANAGLPHDEGGRSVYDVTPGQFAQSAVSLCQKGVRIVGGCCGTTPEHIRAVKAAVLRESISYDRTVCPPLTACTSGIKTVVLDGKVTVIGERINPTGKKRLQAALREKDMAYLLSEAVSQREAGADVLDVNAGLPDLDETAVLPEIIRQIQGIVELPLQIDSSNPAAIEAALRVYNGKPIVNSVSGKQESLDTILPLCKKYGALVVGLTLDENGIPETAEGRLEAACKILSEAQKYGIPSEDILIDCLVLTASAQQNQVAETLRAVRLIKQELGLKTVLGVSNVSFGLPARPLLGSVFLAAALGAGLDAAILNPQSEPFRRTVDAYRVINAEDAGALCYTERYASLSVDSLEAKPSAGSSSVSESQGGGLAEVLEQGRAGEAGEVVRALLKEKAPLDIVNGVFIPVLDRVGGRFAKGELFLPQLLQTAAAIQAGFEVLRGGMEQSERACRGKILLATVKGDIHDIGKNIARMILENYGYTVMDLGKDVPPETIVDAIKTHRIRLCGLSALMTTTVLQMKAVIESARAEGLDCRFMVGGAVLTEEYARLVGADYYASDALEGARIAGLVFGGEF